MLHESVDRHSIRGIKKTARGTVDSLSRYTSL
jgi:hypothetical protein